jgi:hypothetical protein
VAEPPFAAAYVAAYSHGDEVLAEQVASPLYRVEWARRGLSPRDRQSLFPGPSPERASGEWLHFAYVGGAVDGRGFGHLLYLAYPVPRGATSQPSAWRIDTAPDGRVIWAELVYLFSPEATAISPIREGDSVPPLPFQAQLVVGARSLGGPEGYYAALLPAVADKAYTVSSTATVVFFAVDPDGNVRPGAWSYGQVHPGSVAYGQTSTPRLVPLTPELATLERSYVESLCGGC